MTPSAKLFLDKANKAIAHAEIILDAGLADEAARIAYLGAFHAAQAALFEKHGKVFKTHTGVHGEFNRLVKNDPRFDADLTAFLGRAFQLKMIVDYDTDPEADICPDTARSAIAEARRFIAAIQSRLAPPAPEA